MSKKHIIYGENAKRIQSAIDGKMIRALSFEKQAHIVRAEAYSMVPELCNELNVQYAHLIDKPVRIKFNWKTVEYPDKPNEWRGFFKGFEIQSDHIYTRVKLYRPKGNQLDSYPTVYMYSSDNVLSIEPDREYGKD